LFVEAPGLAPALLMIAVMRYNVAATLGRD